MKKVKLVVLLCCLMPVAWASFGCVVKTEKTKTVTAEPNAAEPERERTEVEVRPAVPEFDE